MMLYLFTYLKQRFPLSMYIPIVLLFFVTFYVSASVVDSRLVVSIRTLIGFFIVFLLFFHIRLFDDIKDYQKDLSRDVKRVLDIQKLKQYLIVALMLESICSFILGFQVFLFYLILLVFTIGIFYDFFIRKWLNEYVLVFNFTHQFFIVLLGMFIFFLYHQSIVKISLIYWIFLFDMYLVFALFEFTRKLKKEVKSMGQRSYITIFGKTRFTILLSLLTLAVGISTFLITMIITNGLILPIFEIVVMLLTLSTIILYNLGRVNPKHVKIACFIFMLVTLLVIIVSAVIVSPVIFERGELVMLQ